MKWYLHDGKMPLGPFSPEELAARTGVSMNTLLSRKRYAVLHLRERLQAMQEQYMAEVVLPAIRPAARALLQKHVDAGDLVAIVTATNHFVTAPIARALGVEHLIAAMPEAMSATA